MSQTTTKAAAVLAAACLVPLAFQWNANASLRQEIAGARANPPASRNTGPIDDSSRQLSALRDELAGKHSAILAAENKTAELSELKRKLETEVVYSMGTIESMARELARASRVSTSLDETRDALEKARAADPNSAETRRLNAELQDLALRAAALIPRGIGLIREVLKMERSPEKAGRFYATFLAESCGFDEPTRSAVETRLQSWVADLQRAGLALPQRPKTIERAEWDQRRSEALLGFARSLAADFPDVKWDRFPLDQHLGGGKDAEWFDMFLSEDDQP
jgi:chromosome segregation ATPase